MPQRAAGEPDESYCIGSDKAVLDLIIEVAVTQDTLSKLPLHQAPAIPKVWIWRHGQLKFHALDQEGYQPRSTSRLLPDLDLELLSAHARMPDQYDAVRAFRRAIA